MVQFEKRVMDLTLKERYEKDIFLHVSSLEKSKFRVLKKIK